MEPTAVELQSRGIAVERLGRSRAIAWFFLALSLPALVFTGRVMFSIHGAAGGWVVLTFWGMLVTFLVASARLLGLRFDPARAARSSLRKPGTVTVHGDEIALARPAGNERYPLAELVEGWLESAAEGTTAVLRVRSGDLVSIDTGSVEAGGRLLRAAGVAADQQRWQTRLANSASSVFGGGCLAAAASVVLASVLCVAPIALASVVGAVLDGVATWVAVWRPAAWVAADLFGFVLLLRALTPALLVVGSDGVAVQGFARRRRFVPYAAVLEVRHEARAVVLDLRGESPLRLPTGESDVVLRHAVHDRIADAMASRRAADADGAADVLDRAGRAPGEWRAHLRRLGTEPEGYRTRRVAPERLALVLEDVASTPERRVAAALALARVEDPALRLRVKAAVSSCADEHLRHALEAAAADEIAEEELQAVARKRA